MTTREHSGVVTAKTMMMGIIVMAFLLASWSAHAQGTTPHLLLTWHAESNIPQGFHGKAFPTADSRMTASVMVITGGKAVDLSRETVRWYVNNDLVTGGAGITSATFRAPRIAPNSIDLRVELPEYGNGTLLKTVEIPVVRPEVVIESRYPGGKVPASPALLFARPYFFNTWHPLVSWSVNGVSPEGEQDEKLMVNFGEAPPGSVYQVTLDMGNPSVVGQSARAVTTLIFGK